MGCNLCVGGYRIDGFGVRESFHQGFESNCRSVYEFIFVRIVVHGNLCRFDVDVTKTRMAFFHLACDFFNVLQKKYREVLVSVANFGLVR